MGSSPKSSKYSRGLLGSVGGASSSSRKGQRRVGAALLWLATAAAVVGILRLESMYKLTRLSAWVPARGAGAGGAGLPSGPAHPPAQHAQQRQQQRQPHAQGQQQPAAAAAPPAQQQQIPPRALLLASHSRLVWYDPATDRSAVLHEGEVRAAEVAAAVVWWWWTRRWSGGGGRGGVCGGAMVDDRLYKTLCPTRPTNQRRPPANRRASITACSPAPAARRRRSGLPSAPTTGAPPPTRSTWSSWTWSRVRLWGLYGLPFGYLISSMLCTIGQLNTTDTLATATPIQHHPTPPLNRLTQHATFPRTQPGAELRRVEIPSRFTHDVVRSGDKVYVADTGNGRILEYGFPAMTLVGACFVFWLGGFGGPGWLLGSGAPVLGGLVVKSARGSWPSSVYCC
jgi:hypothetical protein